MWSLYLFKTSSCLYVKSLYPICYPIYIIVLTNRHLHRSTQVSSLYYVGRQVSSLLCNDPFTRVERWRCRLVNTQTLVDKQVKSGYTTCKEAVKYISWKVHFSGKDRYLWMRWEITENRCFLMGKQWEIPFRIGISHLLYYWL